MIYCINHNTLHQFGDLLISNFKLRYKMLVDGQYWNVGRYKAMEYDQYDTPAATHLVWADASGIARGSVRTAPTDRPYMLKDIWPDMVTKIDLPNSLSVWEASRFCVDHKLPSETRKRVKQELVCAFLEFGLQNDVRSMIGVMPDKFWKSCFINNGWNIDYIGDEKLLENGDRIIAGNMPITLDALEKVRKTTGLSEPVLMTQAPEYESITRSTKRPLKRVA